MLKPHKATDFGICHKSKGKCFRLVYDDFLWPLDRELQQSGTMVSDLAGAERRLLPVSPGKPSPFHQGECTAKEEFTVTPVFRTASADCPLGDATGTQHLSAP
jgi:hypothetical protein